MRPKPIFLDTELRVTEISLFRRLKPAWMMQYVALTESTFPCIRLPNTVKNNCRVLLERGSINTRISGP